MYPWINLGSEFKIKIPYLPLPFTNSPVDTVEPSPLVSNFEDSNRSLKRLSPGTKSNPELSQRSTCLGYYFGTRLAWIFPDKRDRNDAIVGPSITRSVALHLEPPHVAHCLSMTLPSLSEHEYTDIRMPVRE